MINRLFRKFFFKKMLKTKNGLYQLNKNFKEEFWSGGKFKRVDQFNDDFVDAIKSGRLGLSTEFSFSNSCRLIARYSRIEMVSDKNELSRDGSLRLCNGVSITSLEQWVDIYNKNFDDPKVLNKVYGALDDLHEIMLQKNEDQTNFMVIAEHLSSFEDDSDYSDLLDLFKFSASKDISSRNYLKSEIASLKVYISVFCAMASTLPYKQSAIISYIDSDCNLFNLVDILIEYQAHVLEVQNGKNEWSSKGVKSLVNQSNYVY
jgi:hypothetical protein